MQSTYLIILFARHIPHVQLVPGHWTDPQRETARQGESIIAELMLFEENYQNEFMLFDLIKSSYWSIALPNGSSHSKYKGCLRWPPSWSSYWEVGGVGWQIFGERKNQLCSSNVKKKERKSFETLLKDLNSCQSRCSTSRPLCWCSNTTWCRFSSRLAETPCSRGTKEIRWKK